MSTTPRMDTDPSTGRQVPYKKANQPYLVHQRWKEEQARKEKEGAERGDAPAPPADSSLFRTALALVAIVLLCGQYFTGDMLYGYRGKWTNWRTYFPPPQKTFTPEQLARYDGSNPRLPLLLAVCGDVFDVSDGRDFYAPGSGYAIFAGKDASRAYVTGCFRTHLTHDIRDFDEQQMRVRAWLTDARSVACILLEPSALHTRRSRAQPPIGRQRPYTRALRLCTQSKAWIVLSSLVLVCSTMIQKGARVALGFGQFRHAFPYADRREKKNSSRSFGPTLTVYKRPRRGIALRVSLSTGSAH